MKKIMLAVMMAVGSLMAQNTPKAIQTQTEVSARPQCAATTKAGKQCLRKTKVGSTGKLCGQHERMANAPRTSPAKS